MSKVKTTGMKCIVTIHDSSDKIIAGQRGASLSRSAETIDVTTKDGDLWSSSIAGFKSWSIDCDGAWIEGDASQKKLNEAFLNGTELKATVYMNVSGTDGHWSSTEKFVGQVIITDFSFDLPYDDLASYSISLQGTGPLGDGTPPSPEVA